MAYLDTMLSQFCTVLRANGIDPVTEYGRRLEPLPDAAEFVTVGLPEVHCGTPLKYGSGNAVPAELHLRVRFHCKTNRDAGNLQVRWALGLVPALLDSGLAVTGFTLGAVTFDRAADRFVREAAVTVSALITQTASQT